MKRTSVFVAIGFLGGSIVGSTHWIVLHRPVELAALTGTEAITSEWPTNREFGPGRHP
jgi:hypothetical protein